MLKICEKVVGNIEITLTIKNKAGLHARPASLFAQKCAGFKSNITIVKNGKSINGKSIINIMSLGIKQGEAIVVNIEGADEAAAAATLEKLVGENFGEA